MVESVQQLVIDATIGDYRLIQRLGYGSFGETWRAFNRKKGLICALKIQKIQETQSQQQSANLDAQNEVEVLKRLDSPFIVKYQDHFYLENDPHGRICIVMDEAESGNLYDQLKGKKKIDEGTVTDWLTTVILGLQVMHQNGICHRDIKPSNIVLQMDVAQLCDFGGSKDLIGSINS